MPQKSCCVTELLVQTTLYKLNYTDNIQARFRYQHTTKQECRQFTLGSYWRGCALLQVL